MVAINTVVISDNNESTLLLSNILPSQGYRIVFEGEQVQALFSMTSLEKPDLIIVILKVTDIAIFEQLKIINEQFPMPIIIFTDDERDDAIENAIEVGVSAYIVDGFSEHRIVPILRTAGLRFSHNQKTQQALKDLKATLADRKVIDRAKGFIMQQRSCSEDEAYKLLRTSAMKQNLRLVVLAQNIINTATLLGAEELH